MEKTTEKKVKSLAEIKESLKTKPWFKGSRFSIQEQLLALDESCVGFLTDLNARPDVMAGVRVISLEGILIPDVRPIFGIFVYFKVQVIKSPDVVYHYQYFTWRQGSESGSKGLVFVEKDDRITHIIHNRGEKFATGNMVNDAFGGFGKANEDMMGKALTNFKKEICEELGMTDITFKRIVPLGRLQVDSGMTPNFPFVFAAIIDGDVANKIKEGDKDNPDIYELEMGTVIVPVEKLGEYVCENDDSFFLSAVLRYLAKYGQISFTK